jgi:hypothetical protein
MTHRPLLGAAAAACLCTPAFAFEPLTFGDFSFTPGLGINLTATRDGDTASNAYGYLDGTLVWTHSFGALTFGAEAYSELEYDSDADGRNLTLYDDPYVDLGFWIEGEQFGYLAYSYTGSASDENCIEAPSTGDNFGHADYATVGTCPGFDNRSVLYYKTPDLGHGLSVAVSYMPQTGFEAVDAGEVSESASLALIYAATDASGAEWSGSLGVERALAVEGGGPRPTAWQAGISRIKDGWTLGSALALTDNGDGSKDWGLGLAAQRDFSDKFSLSAGLNRSHSGAAGGDLNETSLSLIGMYSFVPDKVIADVGIWRIHSDDAGSTSDRTVVGAGLSLYF